MVLGSGWHSTTGPLTDAGCAEIYSWCPLGFVSEPSQSHTLLKKKSTHFHHQRVSFGVYGLNILGKYYACLLLISLFIIMIWLIHFHLCFFSFFCTSLFGREECFHLLILFSSWSICLYLHTFFGTLHCPSETRHRSSCFNLNFRYITASVYAYRK